MAKVKVDVEVVFVRTEEGTAVISVNVPSSIAEDEDAILEYIQKNVPVADIRGNESIDSEDLEVSEAYLAS